MKSAHTLKRERSRVRDLSSLRLKGVALLSLFLLPLSPLLGEEVQPPHAPKVHNEGVRTKEVRVREVRYCMGTQLDLTVYAPSKEVGKRLIEESFAISDKLERVLSNYRPESSVEQFNHSEERELEVEPELFELLQVAERLHRESEGIFDVSIRPVVVVWNSAVKRGVLPSPSELERAKMRVGQGLLELHPPRRVVRRGPVQIETGGIGKGVALDRIAAHLQAAGVKNGFLNFGTSSIVALGSPPGQSAWEAAIEFPGSRSLGTVALRDQSLSLSHSLGQGWEIEGRLYGHVIDPRTAAPLRERRGAAVITESATEGEALSKYLVIKGEFGKAANRPALILEESGAIKKTPSFQW